MRGKALVLIGVIGLTVAALFTAFAILKPTPPSKIVMSTGPPGSAYAIFAEQYREFLALNGIELELRSSAGTFENLARLDDADSGVNVSFVTMGMPASAESTDLESLGAVFFEPLWFFLRSADVSRANLPSALGNRFSIGPPGSMTNFAARRLIELNGIDTEKIELLSLEPREAATRLKVGSIDSAMIITAASAPLIKDLLATQELTLASFERADAYTALYPPLSKLRVPAGLGDLAKNLPPSDVDILSFTAVLAIRGDLHPAIQTLLLDAAIKIHAVPDIFHANGIFPAPRVFHLPLSSNAASYYKNGRPFLHRYLPFWLAVLVMQLLVAALPIVGLVYPAVRAMPAVFDWAMRRRIFKIYGELRALETRLNIDDADLDTGQLLNDLARIEKNVQQLNLPVTFSHLVYNLRTHVNVVRLRINERDSTSN